MRKSNLLIILLVLVFSSCQQEIDFADGTKDSPNELLVKKTEKSASDSVIINYTYDHARRLIREERTGSINGNAIQSVLTLYRNSAGVIIRMSEKGTSAPGTDSVVTNFHFDVSSRRYTSGVNIAEFPGITVRDSVQYHYDATGRIIRDEHFQTITGVPEVIRYQQEYVYGTGGNVESVINSDLNPVSGAYETFFSIAYTYDNKVNPLEMENEGIIITRPEYFGVNNPAKMIVTYTSIPSLNGTRDFIYTYSNRDKPLTGVLTVSPSGNIFNLNYYYQ